jgi:hypothetical protein
VSIPLHCGYVCVYARKQAIKAAYERNHGMSLQRAIEKECRYCSDSYTLIFRTVHPTMHSVTALTAAQLSSSKNPTLQKTCFITLTTPSLCHNFCCVVHHLNTLLQW